MVYVMQYNIYDNADVCIHVSHLLPTHNTSHYTSTMYSLPKYKPSGLQACSGTGISACCMQVSCTEVQCRSVSYIAHKICTETGSHKQITRQE